MMLVHRNQHQFPQPVSVNLSRFQSGNYIMSEKSIQTKWPCPSPIHCLIYLLNGVAFGEDIVELYEV